jgi:hypothetical protein
MFQHSFWRRLFNSVGGLRKPRALRYRPALEGLERRDVPSGSPPVAGNIGPLSVLHGGR